MLVNTALHRAYAGKKVLVTGHTGFKGSWLCVWLEQLGAKLTGYSLPPPTNTSLFEQLGLRSRMDSRQGDIRNLPDLAGVMNETQPEYIFHLAAQSLVRQSYVDPVETFDINVAGTVRVMEAARHCQSVRVIQVITTDKCYENRNWPYPYRESDVLGGHDPYSASKAATEIAAASYRSSYFNDQGVSLSTVRAGNVIGGGDWAADRIIPDCVRALQKRQPIVVRNPDYIRPWQHVLEPLAGYLWLAVLQAKEPARYAQAWNFGPSASAAVPVRHIVESLHRCWQTGQWLSATNLTPAAHEAAILSLDSSKARALLGWHSCLALNQSIQWTADWYGQYVLSPQEFDVVKICHEQIQEYSRIAADIGCDWAQPAVV